MHIFPYPTTGRLPSVYIPVLDGRSLLEKTNYLCYQISLTFIVPAYNQSTHEWLSNTYFSLVNVNFSMNIDTTNSNLDTGVANCCIS